MTNAFRMAPDGSLDRQYLRTCAVYRLMDRRNLGKERAIELLKARRVPVPVAVVEMWLAGPLSEKGRRERARQREWMNAA